MSACNSGSGSDSGFADDPRTSRPSISGVSSDIVEMLSHPDLFSIVMGATVLAIALMPGIWLAAIPFGLGYGAWFYGRKYRLPFRLPAAWTGPDYSNPEPGSVQRFRQGQGILYLGNDISTGEELWLSNSDARRHAFVLGTTGAGKALPVDSLLLTPGGWTRNGDIRPGDKVIHPSGESRIVLSIHPQGPLSVVKIQFADGRIAECSRDHLWSIRKLPRNGVAVSEWKSDFRLCTAGDLGIELQMGKLQDLENPAMRFFAPYPSAMKGNLSGSLLTEVSAGAAAINGMESLDFFPSLAGTQEQRLEWLARFLANRIPAGSFPDEAGFIEIPILGDVDGFRIRHVIWSLGGYALQVSKRGLAVVRATYPGQQRIGFEFGSCDPAFFEKGLEIVDIEGFPDKDGDANEPSLIGHPSSDDKLTECTASSTRDPALRFEKEMTCIRTDSDDGLFVTENYIVTHNTELLLGMVAQSLMWSSGFLFIDGKGTAEFHARAWSLVSRFGRQDDYRILNFTDSGEDPDTPAGGPGVQSNTLNPFSHGTQDQLMNLVVSLMSDVGSGTDMWKHRAMSLVASTMKALCEMRDAGDILLDVQSIRDYLPLGSGIKKDLLEGKTISEVAEVPTAAWKELRSRGGIIELYLRALNGEFSETSKLALKGFFDSLPGFSLHRALNGDAQESKAVEQHGFLAMQLTKPLGSLADDFGHIFRTPYGEIDIEDIVLNRRILVVLLPALQKAPEEMRNCGKIVVAMLKMMMAKASGSEIEGSKQTLIDARPTRSPSPFIAVLDEAGYYMVKGIDTMMAQARSLGFMIVIAGQDMAAMQATSPQIAETASANARLTAAGAMEDAQRTWEFLRRKFAQHRVPLSSGKTARSGLLGTRWANRIDVSFVKEDRVKIQDLQRLREGEFYFLMESKLVKARTFYVGEHWASKIAANKYLLVRGPADRAPGLDQSKEIAFLEALSKIGEIILDEELLVERMNEFPDCSQDSLACALRYIESRISRLSEKSRTPAAHRDASLLGLIFGLAEAIPREETLQEDRGGPFNVF